MWGLWQNNVAINQILEAGKILCWASKWVGSKEIKFAKHDEGHFLTAMHALLDEADVVLTYNGKRFDIPHLNRQFILAGLKPPSPYKQIDLLETVKRQFRFPSNKLDFVSQELGLGQKTHHEGFPLWIKCLQGSKPAWATMEKYNKNDVTLLEKLYKLLLPWIANHPNHNLYGDVGVCPNCGSKHVQKRGTYKTQTGIYTRIACQSCGSWSRTRYTEIDKEKAREVYTGVALG